MSCAIIMKILKIAIWTTPSEAECLGNPIVSHAAGSVHDSFFSHEPWESIRRVWYRWGCSLHRNALAPTTYSIPEPIMRHQIQPSCPTPGNRTTGICPIKGLWRRGHANRPLKTSPKEEPLTPSLKTRSDYLYHFKYCCMKS